MPLLQRPSSKVNLRAALEKRASIKSVQTMPTGSAQHYKLPTQGDTMEEAKAPLDRRDTSSESDDESIENEAQPKKFTKTTAQKKLEATLRGSRQEVGGVSPTHSSPVDVGLATASPQSMEKIGGNLPQVPGGGKARSAFSLSPKKSEDRELKKATPTRGAVGDYDDDNFDSDESDVDAIPEEMSDPEGEGEESEGEGEPAGYNPCTSFGSATSSLPGSRRVSPHTSPFTSPIHEGGLHGNYQTPTKKAISPLTKSIRSSHSMTPPPSQTELATTKTASVSVDVGSKEQKQLHEYEKEGVKDSDGLPNVLSSATDEVTKEDGRQDMRGEEERERVAGLNVCLSSATDQPSSSSQNKRESSTLTGVLSSSTDQEKQIAAAGGLTSYLSSATDQEKDASLTASLSSATDQPLKKGTSLPTTLSSTTDQLLKRGASFAVDQPLKKGASLDSYATDLKPSKRGAGLPTSFSSATDEPLKKGASLDHCLSSATDQPLKKGASFAVDLPSKKGASLDHFLSSATDQPLKKNERETLGASLSLFPSSATDPLPLAAPPSTKPETSAGAHRDDSLEGLLTIDEELTDSDNDDSYDYVEEIVGTPGYVPSDPMMTPKRRGGAARLHSSTGSLSTRNMEEKAENSSPDKASPIQLSKNAQKLSTTTLSLQQTPTKDKSSAPSQQVTTPISDSSLVPVSPLSAGLVISEFSEVKGANSSQANVEALDDFSDILKSDDDNDEIEKLLGEAEELSPKKMSAAEKKEASELFASVLKAAEEREMVEEKTLREAVDDSKVVKKGELSTQKQEDVLDIEAQYEGSEWDSEDEESEGESDNEEEGGGTALAWLSNAGLADPFVSPLTSPTHSTPTSPRKPKPRSHEEESRTAATTTSLATAVVSSAHDTDKEEKGRERIKTEVDEPGHPLVCKVTTPHLPEEKKQERDAVLEQTTAAAPAEPGYPLVRIVTTPHLPERKGESEDLLQLMEDSTVTEPGHPLERKETVTNLSKNKEVKGERAEAADSVHPTEVDNELGHPHVHKETVIHLKEDKREEEKRERKTDLVKATADNELGYPLICKETVTHLPENKEVEKREKDSVQATAAVIDNEPGHPLERKDTLTNLPEEKGRKRGKIDKREEADSVQATAAAVDNEPGHPLERKDTLTHLPEDKKAQQPRVLGLSVSPHHRDGDDTEEDATVFTNTESEVNQKIN